jgi:hypothetical protein
MMRQSRGFSMEKKKKKKIITTTANATGADKPSKMCILF